MLTSPAGVRGTYLHNGSTSRLSIPSGMMLTRAVEDETVVMDQCEKGARPVTPELAFQDNGRRADRVQGHCEPVL